MIRMLMGGIAAAAVAMTAAPALAQDDEYVEEPRTTYELRFIDLAPGAEQEFLDRMEKYYAPARAKAGFSPVEVHFLMTGKYDLLLVMEMPGGMASFDTHRPATGVAFRQALLEVVGGEEALEELNESSGDLVEDTMSIYSHTHP